MSVKSAIEYIESRTAELDAEINEINNQYFASAEYAEASDGLYEEGDYLGIDIGMRDYFAETDPLSLEKTVLLRVLDKLKEE